MGHIIHNDFVVMTTVSAIPIIFYTVYRVLYDAARQPGGDSKGKGYAMMIAMVAFVAYVITQVIVLLISRYREYWADKFSAEKTKKPNTLSTALTKIAYGLASEGLGANKEKQVNYENALMISDPRMARSLAFNAEALKSKKN